MNSLIHFHPTHTSQVNNQTQVIGYHPCFIHYITPHHQYWDTSYLLHSKPLSELGSFMFTPTTHTSQPHHQYWDTSYLLHSKPLSELGSFMFTPTTHTSQPHHQYWDTSYLLHSKPLSELGSFMFTPTTHTSQPHHYWDTSYLLHSKPELDSFMFTPTTHTSQVNNFKHKLIRFIHPCFHLTILQPHHQYWDTSYLLHSKPLSELGSFMFTPTTHTSQVNNFKHKLIRFIHPCFHLTILQPHHQYWDTSYLLHSKPLSELGSFMFTPTTHTSQPHHQYWDTSYLLHSKPLSELGSFMFTPTTHTSQVNNFKHKLIRFIHPCSHLTILQPHHQYWDTSYLLHSKPLSELGSFMFTPTTHTSQVNNFKHKLIRFIHPCSHLTILQPHHQYWDTSYLLHSKPLSELGSFMFTPTTHTSQVNNFKHKLIRFIHPCFHLTILQPHHQYWDTSYLLHSKPLSELGSFMFTPTTHTSQVNNFKHK
ncbi:hypothetical protein J6590_075928 [Homalodisca vitripennis]|nr:hypothetical protein J6590_075928 [Homalodisca vitripennis]